jgi:quercetin dioxygenase-like cupin family protein
MVKTVLVVTILLLAAPWSAGQKFDRTPQRVATPPIRKISDPAYQHLTEDEQLAAYSISIPAHGATQRNGHVHDYLLVAVGNCDLEISGHGNSYKMHLDDGDMQVMKGGWAHSIANLNGAAATLLEVDVAKGIEPERADCGLYRAACKEGRFGKDDQGTFLRNMLFQTPTVRLSRIELGPGGVLEQHMHRGEQVLIAITDVNLTDGLAGGTPDQVRSTAGDVRVYSAGTMHTIRNVGQKAARFLELELR